MNDFQFSFLGTVAVVIFVAGWCALEYYGARVVRKASGENDTSSWQPAARPIAALAFASLLALPIISRVAVGWPRTAFGLFYASYATALMALVLVLSASSASFQRFAFSQQPVPAGVARRFIFGIVFFLCLFLASTFGYFYFA
jgi:hypothetical protein